MIMQINIRWNNGYQNDGLLYFFQRVHEMLDYNTSDIFRAPLHNTPSLIAEYLEIYNGSAKHYNLDEVLHEFVESFRNDIVLQRFLGDSRINFIINRLNKYPEKRESTMEYLFQSIGRKYLYWIKIIAKELVYSNKEKRKIEKIVRCFVPEAMRMGYSRDEMYYSVKQFLTTEIDPATALDEFFDQYNRRKRKYSAYLGISERIRQFENALQPKMRITSEDDGLFNKLEVRDGYYVVKIDDISALDANNAANYAYESIRLFTTFFQYFGNYGSSLIQKAVLVVSEDGIERKVIVNREKFNSVGDDNPFMVGELSDLSLTKLAHEGTDVLPVINRIAMLHNRAIANNGIENGFLNLWSILEIICVSDPDGSKINQVIQAAIPILKREYFPSVIYDITSDVERTLGKEGLDSILNEIEVGDNKYEKIASLIFLPEYQEKLDFFVDSFLNYPVLRSRILNLNDDCKKKKEILHKANQYAKRVSWHMYRIYRARNQIIHLGKKPRSIKDLGEHLHSYIDSITDDVFVALLLGPFKTISSVLVNAELENEIWEQLYGKDEAIDTDCIKALCHNFTVIELSNKNQNSP